MTRLGKSVVLVTYNNHVGGMFSGGLGVTDHGNTSSIGGIAAEFYRRVGQAQGSSSPVYWFEAHVAEQTFWQMLREAGGQNSGGSYNYGPYVIVGNTNTEADLDASQPVSVLPVVQSQPLIVGRTAEEQRFAG
jgi:hypothetical protein